MELHERIVDAARPLVDRRARQKLPPPMLGRHGNRPRAIHAARRRRIGESASRRRNGFAQVARGRLGRSCRRERRRQRRFAALAPRS